MRRQLRFIAYANTYINDMQLLSFDSRNSKML